MTTKENENQKNEIVFRLDNGCDYVKKEPSTKYKISIICENLSNFLHTKDSRYGSSISEPIHVFAKGSSDDLLYARIDDKINRIRNSEELRKNDVVDLMGYLVWVCVKKGWFSFRDLID
jgi:hypothetical protein